MIEQAFLRTSKEYLAGEYVPKIRACLNRLDDETVWWRPGEASNSVGNLVLHLCGNARQWILHGVLGREDVRERSSEFEARGGIGVPALVTHLEEQIGLVCEGLDEVHAIVGDTPTYLLGRRTIQGNDVSVLEAIYHVVEHFAQHTGQIIWVTKQRHDTDLGFWSVQDGHASKNW